VKNLCQLSQEELAIEEFAIGSQAVPISKRTGITTATRLLANVHKPMA
jgi:hypothetical protein